MENLVRYWRGFCRRYPRLSFAFVGVAIGAIFGLFFGGIGIAARGSAWGVPGSILFGAIGGFAADYIYRRRKLRTR